MKEVMLWDDARTIPKGYRSAVCECLIMKFIIFKNEITDFECPNCHTKYHTDGYGDWISRIG